MNDDASTGPAGAGPVGPPGQSRPVSDQSLAGDGFTSNLLDPADEFGRLRSWASQLARKGYHVIPVRVRRDPNGKKLLTFPMGDRWQHTASPDPAKVRAMPWEGATHVFVATGPSGIVVPDLDVGNGKDGPAEWRKRRAEHPDTPRAPKLRTGSGGLHLFYRATPQAVKSGKNTLGPGIDTRAVGGGLIVWSNPENLPPVTELPECPAWIPQAAPAERSTPKQSGTFTGRQPSGLAGLLSLPPHDDGRGNDWLTQVAGHLARRLPDHGEYLALLRLADEASDHPHDADVFAKTADSIWSREQAKRKTPTGREWPPPDKPVKVARQFIGAYRYDEQPTLCRWNSGWYRWDGARWAEVSDEAMETELVQSLESAVYEARDGGDIVYKDWDPNAAKINDAKRMLRSLIQAPELGDPPFWMDERDGDPREYVPLANGLLHVPTRRLLPATPAYFTENAVPYGYDPDAPEPVQWLRFLKEVWPDDPTAIDALQEWFGYVVSGRTDLQTILFMIGASRAGKGVINRILKALVGKGNVVSPRTKALAGQFGLEDFLGKSLAIIGDGKLNSRTRGLDDIVELLKSVSGEDDPSVSRKGRTSWHGRLPTRIVLVSNEVPDLRDASGAAAARALPLWFSHTVPKSRRDPKLADRIIATELPGVLLWALRGLDRLNANGQFTIPLSSAGLVQELDEGSSHLNAFIADRCVVAADQQVWVKDLYRVYATWAAIYARKELLDEGPFGKELRALPHLKDVIERKREGPPPRRYYYAGIGLLDSTANKIALGEVPS